MAINTYEALNTVSLASAAASATFTSIPQGYTDLILVCNVGSETTNAFTYLQFNGDTGTNYSFSQLYGTGSGAFNSRVANTNQLFNSDVSMKQGAINTNVIYQVMNYANSSTFKTALSRQNTVDAADYNGALAAVGIWRNTAAITRIDVKATRGGTAYNFTAGSTFTLYGVKAWVAESTPKATGGYVYSDATYWYHAFPFSSTFTPNISLTADILVVAGGGGGGMDGGGGGGAGGLRGFDSQTLSATAYPVVVGSGGAASTSLSSKGSNGSTSTFNSNSATGGGGGGSDSSASGASGGSGGGGRLNRAGNTGGSGNAGSYSPSEGNAGADGSSSLISGGGGGAGGAGNNTTASGGVGSSAYSSWGLATRTGENVLGTVYYAGGGGANYAAGGGLQGAGGFGGGGLGSSGSTAGFYSTNGSVSTGGGGGGGSGQLSEKYVGGHGGSGIVIVRYVK